VHYTIVPLPDINIAASTVAGCEPLSVQFFETTPQPGDTYLWYFGDQTYSNLQNPQHTYFNHGQYDVALCVTNIYGCSDTVFAENYITVYPNPFAAFTYSPPQLDEINSTVNFINGTLNIEESHWSFGDGETSLQYNPTHTYTTAGTYEVQLLVITEYGCRDSTMLTIDIRNIYTLYIPNAFTPNENGLNEFFIPKGDNFNPDEYVFMIYDRWGGKVFETTNVSLGWDGAINGEPCKSGVYAYVIHFREKTGLEQKYIGHVTLIR
jgi:gliding motility-associated-like protein